MALTPIDQLVFRQSLKVGVLGEITAGAGADIKIYLAAFADRMPEGAAELFADLADRLERAERRAEEIARETYPTTEAA